MAPLPLALIPHKGRILHFSCLRNLGASFCPTFLLYVPLPGATALARTAWTGLGDFWTGILLGQCTGDSWKELIHLPQPQRSVSLSRAVWTHSHYCFWASPRISWPAGGVTARHHTGFPAGKSQEPQQADRLPLTSLLHLFTWHFLRPCSVLGAFCV